MHLGYVKSVYLDFVNSRDLCFYNKPSGSKNCRVINTFKDIWKIIEIIIEESSFGG